MDCGGVILFCAVSARVYCSLIDFCAVFSVDYGGLNEFCAVFSMEYCGLSEFCAVFSMNYGGLNGFSEHLEMVPGRVGLLLRPFWIKWILNKVCLEIGFAAPGGGLLLRPV